MNDPPESHPISIDFEIDYPLSGAAHGYSGIFYLLLKNRTYCTPEQQKSLIEDCLRLVQTQLLKNGNMTSRLGGSGNDLVQVGFLFTSE